MVFPQLLFHLLISDLNLIYAFIPIKGILWGDLFISCDHGK
ncbi:hypothetical protein FM120_24070 [Sphingobacterium faecium PCAi_F2.5]|nr:hypothetical protein FM120_24070 [Sphingobacterium faecium PCAi_F2.5]